LSLFLAAARQDRFVEVSLRKHLSEEGTQVAARWLRSDKSSLNCSRTYPLNVFLSSDLEVKSTLLEVWRIRSFFWWSAQRQRNGNAMVHNHIPNHLTNWAVYIQITGRGFNSCPYRCNRGVKLTFYLHLVPRSKNEWIYTFTPLIRLHGVVLS
jgi:hypothetical protein